VPAVASEGDARRLERVEAIDQLLPQTQCRRCGFNGCRPYAEALADDQAAINRCPPGGHDGVVRLAALLGRDILPIDPDCGPPELPRRIARIIDADCIGCTLCIQACPVDAIIGTPKRMHTVIAEHCTGCELCITPCPIDCITLDPASDGGRWTTADADLARQRYERRAARLQRRDLERARDRIVAGTAKLAALAVKAEGPAEPLVRSTANEAPSPQSGTAKPDEATRKRAVIEAAIRRARERLAAAGQPKPPEGDPQ
jgi:electron transport complex protein RnfB